MTEAVFWTVLALLGYAYAGYPVLAWTLARLRPRVVLRRGGQPSVTLIVVARNGERWIEDKLDNCLTLDYPHDQLDVVLVLDGSTDATAARARAFESPRVEIVECGPRRGKAACLNEAVTRASGDILVFTDVRQRLDAAAIRNLVMNFADEKVGAVSAELLRDPGRDGFTSGMDLYWRYEKWLRTNEARFASSVGVTGGTYALRRECYRPIPEGTILDDVLIPMNVVAQGLRVVFDRTAIARDMPASSRSRERRHRIRAIAGNCQLLLQQPALLIPWRNPVWLQFVSHRLLRLFVPFLLFAALVANFILAAESHAYQLLLIGQLMLYIIALLGVLLPEAQRLNLIRVPTTFLLLNWFAVLGLLSFARHRRSQP